MQIQILEKIKENIRDYPEQTIIVDEGEGNSYTYRTFDLAARRIVYNDNPIDEWCLMNTSYEEDKNGNIQPKKTMYAASYDSVLSASSAMLTFDSAHDVETGQTGSSDPKVCRISSAHISAPHSS